MYYQLPLQHRRHTNCSELPVQRAHPLLAKPAHPSLDPSLDETLEAFHQECTIHEKQTATGNWESGRRYMTHAGFRVRSKAEKIIADCLTQGGIRFLYEPVLRACFENAFMQKPSA